jgi:DNA-binding GntR family transcriptional regulator
LVEALAERDGDFAERLMRRHVAAALRGILGSLDAETRTPQMESGIAA